MQRNSIGPQFDVGFESEEFIKTFSEYARLVNLTTVQAVEKQAKNLRIRLVVGFKQVKLKKGQAGRELKQRGGRIKIRRSIRESYKDTDVFKGSFLNRKSKATLQSRQKSRRQGVKGATKQIPAWSVAVARELAARERSRTFLAASWLNPHEASETPRMVRLASIVKSGLKTGEVDVNTTGDSPQIILRNFVRAVGIVGESKGIIASALQKSRLDMRTYIERKLEQAKQKAGV